MDWLQFGIFLLTIGGIYWSTRSDLNALRAEASADRRDILQLVRSIDKEMKDFHGRLCAIEERNRNHN